MNDIVIGIHPLHRKLAEITQMSMDREGNITIGRPELKLILPLLRQNYELVSQLDQLKQLSFIAYEVGDHDWLMDLSAKIEKLEEALEI